MPSLCSIDCSSVLGMLRTLPPPSLQVLLPAASLLQLMDVRQVCCNFLRTQLHPTNCLGIRAFADLHACTQLMSQAQAYAGEPPGGAEQQQLGLCVRILTRMSDSVIVHGSHCLLCGVNCLASLVSH